MNEIFRLGEDVANMVAAGEVVERPFNVIKELMENSADAGASRISVIVENGGVGMVRVTDNGRGILPGDMPVAVQRFATSKIKTADDVYNVKTFGFRGEALAAISSVSDFSIRSCRKGNDGAEIRIKHGGEPQVLPAPALEGTTVEVRSLFANVPARLKFFKSFSAEEREIAKFVRSFSVINPHIAVELTVNGKSTYSASADMDMKARAVQVTRERDLVYGENEYEGMKLSFVTSLPTVQRYRKDMIIIGINGRVVKDMSLTQAVVTAYNRMIPDGKFPAAAISLYVDPEKVDVNVHPAKTTVKLLDGRDIFSFVHHSIKNRLDEAGHDQGVQMRSEAPATSYTSTNSYTSTYKPETKYDHRLASQSYDMAGEMEVVEYEHRSEAQIVNVPEQSGEESSIRVVGQLFNTVIVCEKDGEALFIDQHVAHERVLYEKFIREAQMSVPSVVMYEPILINVGDEELAIAEDSKDVFEQFGYEIESFGGESLKVSRVPTEVLNRDIEAQVKGILADMIEERKDTSVDYRALVMSCKAAVKAGDKLEMHEMRKLVSDLFTTDNPYTCPHGRPIVFKQTEEFFLRKFGR
jgi:DNA mismatch repair protein MutL